MSSCPLSAHLLVSLRLCSTRCLRLSSTEPIILTPQNTPSTAFCILYRVTTLNVGASVFLCGGCVVAVLARFVAAAAAVIVGDVCPCVFVLQSTAFSDLISPPPFFF